MEHNTKVSTVHGDFLPEFSVERAIGERDFTVRKPGKYDLNQVIKVNINNDKSY